MESKRILKKEKTLMNTTDLAIVKKSAVSEIVRE